MRLRLQQGVLDLDTGAFDGVEGVFPGVELRLLRYLAEQGRPVDQAELLEKVWGYAPTTRTRTVRVTIGRIRKKLEKDPAHPRHLRTDVGRGYALVAPIDTGQLFGRSEVRRQLEEAGALVTLVGPGGVGKTAVARRFCEDEGGVWVDCSAAHTSADLVRAVGAALGLGRSPSIAADIALDQTPLLVLDNLEQVDDPAVLEQWTDGRIVATSRLPLGLDREETVPLEPLGAPDARDPFQLRWTEARGGDLSDESASRIVAGVGGLPLALELAASWASLLTPAQLQSRIEEGIGWLEDPSREQKHQTIRAVFASSWSLIPADEQAVLAQLRVFIGPIDLGDAEAIAQPRALVLPALRRATQLGLLRRVGGRVILLRPVRDLLPGGDAVELEARHAEHFLARAHALSTQGPDLSRGLAGLEELRANLVGAWRRSSGSRRQDLAAALDPLLFHRGPPALHEEVARELGGARHAEALRLLGRLDEALAVAVAAGARRVEAYLLITMQRPAEAVDVLDRALLEAETPRSRGELLSLRAWAEMRRGRYAESLPMFRAALEVVEPIGDPALSTRVLTRLAEALAYVGRIAEADAVSERAVGLDPEGRGAAEAWVIRTRLHSGQGRIDEAIAALQAGAQVAGSVRQRAVLAQNLGSVLLGAGRDAEAVEALLRAVHLARTTPELVKPVRCLLALGCAALGRRTEARAHIDSVEAMPTPELQLAWQRVLLGMAARILGDDPMRHWAPARAFYAKREIHGLRDFCDLLVAAHDPGAPIPDTVVDDPELNVIHATLRARRAGRPDPELPRAYRVRFALADRCRASV